MASTLPGYHTILKVANEHIQGVVQGIMKKKVKEAQDEIAEVMPRMLGRLSAQVTQECMKVGSIEPQFTINIVINKETEA